ncbi:MAG: penicillin-binding transpeptidase domain-containing protein [Acidimicrobiales bacterium]
MARKTWIAVGAAVAVGVSALSALILIQRADKPAPPTQEVAAFLAAWERFDVATLGPLVDRPDEAGPAIVAMRDQLSVSGARLAPGSVTREGETAEAGFRAELDVAGLGTWSYGGRIRLARSGDRWLVTWSPSTLHPDFIAGHQFGKTRAWPRRAAILGSDGTPLVNTDDAIVVGLRPGRVQDQAEVQATLERLLGVSPADVRSALAQASGRPEDFVPIIPVTAERLASVRAQLEPVPGVFFERASRSGPGDDFAGHVLGHTGEVTAELLEELGPPYLVGDRVGLSGVELAYERRLAGAPSGDVQLLDPGGAVVRVLHHFPEAAPRPIQLTLDRSVQQAAEQALSGVTQPAALVAVDAATGDVRAVVSRPLDQFNRALAGQYPPGSTFKVVTSAGLLANGVRPGDTVPCPAETTVGGRKFVNFEAGALGSIPFSTAFAKSCNTAFASLSERLPAPALVSTAASFGFGSSYDLGLPTAGGEFPLPSDATELAAAALGQGRVLASPLHMATVAAAVASGSWHAPRLVTEAQPAPNTALDGTVAATLRELMLAVVREGTGTAAARPGQEVAGKTGTAEFGTGDPPLTHAWFIGFRGQLAFAVLVEEGGVGGRVAAPLAARFLDALPAQ